MSSTKFESTFERVCDIVATQYPDPNVLKILRDFRKRTSTSDRNPLRNRSLLVDPRIDSQMLDVPEELYKVVVREFRTYRLIHVWVRLLCPNTEGVVVETRRKENFLKAIERPCSHCGQEHSETHWDQVEYFFAFNFKLSDERLNIRDLLEPNIMQLSEPKKQDGFPVRWLWRTLLGFFLYRDDSAKGAITSVLAQNRPAKLPPTINEIFWSVAGIVLAWYGITFLLAIVAWMCGYLKVAIGIVAISVVLFVMISIQVFRVVNFLQPMKYKVISTANAIGLATLSIGAFGFNFKFNSQVNKPFSLAFEAGDSDKTLIGLGFLLTISGWIVGAYLHRIDMGRDIG